MSAAGDRILAEINKAKTTSEMDRILHPLLSQELLQELLERSGEILNDPIRNDRLSVRWN